MLLCILFDAQTQSKLRQPLAFALQILAFGSELQLYKVLLTSTLFGQRALACGSKVYQGFHDALLQIRLLSPVVSCSFLFHEDYNTKTNQQTHFSYVFFASISAFILNFLMYLGISPLPFFFVSSSAFLFSVSFSRFCFTSTSIFLISFWL